MADLFVVVHDWVSPTADVVTEDELRALLWEFSCMPGGDNEQDMLDSLEVREDGIYADASDGLGVVLIAIKTES